MACRCMDLRHIASRVAAISESDENDAERISWWDSYLSELHRDVSNLNSMLEAALKQCGDVWDLPPDKRRVALIALAMTMKAEIPNHKGIMGLKYMRDTIGRETADQYYRVGDDASANRAAYEEMRRLDSIFKPFRE